MDKKKRIENFILFVIGEKDDINYYKMNSILFTFSKLTSYHPYFGWVQDSNEMHFSELVNSDLDKLIRLGYVENLKTISKYAGQSLRLTKKGLEKMEPSAISDRYHRDYILIKDLKRRLNGMSAWEVFKKFNNLHEDLLETYAYLASRGELYDFMLASRRAGIEHKKLDERDSKKSSFPESLHEQSPADRISLK